MTLARAGCAVVSHGACRWLRSCWLWYGDVQTVRVRSHKIPHRVLSTRVQGPHHSANRRARAIIPSLHEARFDFKFGKESYLTVRIFRERRRKDTTKGIKRSPESWQKTNDLAVADASIRLDGEFGTGVARVAHEDDDVVISRSELLGKGEGDFAFLECEAVGKCPVCIERVQLQKRRDLRWSAFCYPILRRFLQQKPVRPTHEDSRRQNHWRACSPA